MGRVPGRHGGDIRTLIGGQRDIRLMTLYGYSRLVGYDEKLVLQPDILESYDIVEDRIFTFKIREGHKWSDGSPFTAEDFRYAWEDTAQRGSFARRSFHLSPFEWQTARLRDHRSVDRPL